MATLPANATIKAEAALFKNPVKELLAKEKNFWPLTLRENSDIEQDHQTCFDLGLEAPTPTAPNVTPGMFPPTSSALCDLYSQADKKALRKQLAATFGGKWTLGNVCGYLVSVSNNPDLGGKSQWCNLYNWTELLALGIDCFPHSLFSFARARDEGVTSQYFDKYGLLRKDACGKASTKYVVKIDVDLTNVAPESLDGFTTSVRIQEMPHNGKRRALLKPQSDGRYKPKPIVLLEWLNDACGNTLSLTRWSAGRPLSTTILNMYGFLIRSDDLTLALGLVDKVLKGGKGTFELSDGYDGYGVCMNLVKKRQAVNGYS